MKNINVILGVIGVVIVAGLIYYAATSNSVTSTNTATSTPVVIVKTPTTPVVKMQEAGSPLVVTSPNILANEVSALVTGTVIPRGLFTTYWFEYGTTANLGNKTASQNIGSGYIALAAPSYISGLSKNTTYYMRIVAENEYGRQGGTQYTFKTQAGTPAPTGSVPTVKTLTTSGLSRTAVNLQGEVTPNLSPTTYWFEYGRTSSLGNISAFQTISSASSKTQVLFALSNLDPATNYFYRLNAQNQWGTVNGTTLGFKTSGPADTAKPSVDTNSATNIKATTATLRGTVNANEVATTYWFEYSTDSLLGSVLLKSTEHKQAGSGKNDVSFDANISGLVSNTNYFYRIVAENSLGTNYGDRVSFKTK